MITATTVDLRQLVIQAVEGRYPSLEILRDLHFQLAITKPHFDHLVRLAREIREAFATGTGWERDQARKQMDPQLADGINALATKLSGIRTRQEACDKVICDFRRHKLSPGKYDTLRPQTGPTPKQLLRQNLEAAEFVLAQDGSYKWASVVGQRDQARRGLRAIAAAEHELTTLREQASEIEGEIGELRAQQADWRNCRL